MNTLEAQRVFIHMTLKEIALEVYAKWFPAKEIEAKTTEVEAPKETEVNMAEVETPAPTEPNVIEERIAALEEAVKMIITKIDEVIEAKAAPDATAMSAIEVLKAELTATKAEVTKLAAAPVGDIAGKETKKKVEFSKMKPAVADLVARITKN